MQQGFPHCIAERHIRGCLLLAGATSFGLPALVLQ